MIALFPCRIHVRSKAVYDLHDNKRIRRANLKELKTEGWDVLEEKVQGDYAFWKSPDALAMAVFVNEKRKVKVLALKGTSELKNASDLHMNVASILGPHYPAQPVLNAAAMVKEHQKGGYKVMVTGHSLGGYMAEVVATTLDISGVGFCAPGSGWHAGEFGFGVKGSHKIFQNVNFEHDFLGNVAAGIYEHSQWSFYVPAENTFRFGHGMSLMEETLAKRLPGWTLQTIRGKSVGNWTGFGPPKK